MAGVYNAAWYLTSRYSSWKVEVLSQPVTSLASELNLDAGSAGGDTSRGCTDCTVQLVYVCMCEFTVIMSSSDHLLVFELLFIFLTSLLVNV